MRLESHAIDTSVMLVESAGHIGLLPSHRSVTASMNTGPLPARHRATAVEHAFPTAATLRPSTRWAGMPSDAGMSVSFFAAMIEEGKPPFEEPVAPAPLFSHRNTTASSHSAAMFMHSNEMLSSSEPSPNKAPEPPRLPRRFCAKAPPVASPTHPPTTDE